MLQKTKGNVQSSLSQRTNRVFCYCGNFFLSVCLMDWYTLGWFVCIWSCSEESQLRVGLNLDRGKTIWVLGFFFFPLFFVCIFFLWISGWVFYKGLVFFFFFFSGWTGWKPVFDVWNGVPCEILNYLYYTCQHLKGVFLLTCQLLVKSFCFYILYMIWYD